MAALRYVILRHDGIESPHFDILLEISPDSALLAWRSSHWPPAAAEIFEPLAEHRRLYLNYEGPLSDDRGAVHRVAAATYQLIGESPAGRLIELDDGLRLVLPWDLPLRNHPARP